MSDEQAREIERRWKETGSAEDHARLLMERVRVGTLKRDCLELAAYCGHAAALLATGRPVSRTDTLADWVAGLEPFGAEAWVRAAVALTREVFPIWRRCRHAASDDYFHQALRAAESWCMEPTPENTRRASALSHDAGDRIDDLPEDVSREEDMAAAVTSWAAQAASGRDLGEAMRSVVELALNLAHEEDLGRRVRLELVPWCLGLDDPLRWSAA